MSSVHSFHGGIHPPENKRQSNGAPIQAAPIPAKLVLPLSQHIGAPAEPLVKVGDRVLKGQVIAEPIGRISKLTCANLRHYQYDWTSARTACLWHGSELHCHRNRRAG
jgi:hypothetical protein